MWLTTGMSPLEQVREGGWLAVFVMWPVIGTVFAPVHVFGAFVEGGSWHPAAIVAITACLMALWIVALRRGHAYEHTIARSRF